MIDVEALRQKVLDHKDYHAIADATGYPYHSLTKFAYGIVKEPGLNKLFALHQYFEREAA